MNLAKKGPLAIAAVTAAMMLITTQPKQTEAQWAVFDATVDGTLASLIPANATAVSSTVTSTSTAAKIDADINEGLNIAKWALELKPFASQLSRIGNAGGLQTAIAANNANPLRAGTQLAEMLVNATPGNSNGVLTTSDLNGLEGEIASAVGGLTGQGANLDGVVAEITGQKETTDLQAAIELQNETGVIDAAYEKAEALDIASSVQCINCSGGFQAPHIRDYSQGAPGQNPGSVF